MLQLPLLASSFALGIWASSAHYSGALLWGAGLLAATLLLLSWVFRRPSLRLAALVALGFSGGNITLLASGPNPRACDVSRHHGPEVVRLVLELTDAPRPTAWGQRQRARGLWVSRNHGPWQPLCGTVELSRPSAAPALWPGQRIRLAGRLVSAVGRRNPGVNGGLLRRRMAGIRARVYAVGDALVLRSAGRASPWSRFRQFTRLSIGQAVVDGRARAIITALVLGEKHLVTDEQRAAFAGAGLAHLLAVSGLHLSLLAFGAMAVLSVVLSRSAWITQRWVPRRLVAPVAALLVVGYTVFTGASTATIRACVMACALLVGLVVGRKHDLLRPFSLAALLLLIGEPLQLFTAGFQLSFAAVAGIALVASHPLTQAASERIASWPGARLWRWFFGMLLASLGATLSTAPLVAYHFGTVALVGLLLNMAAIPLTAFVVLPAALIATLLTPVWGQGAAVLFALGGYGAGWLDTMARWGAHVPFSNITLRPGLAVATGWSLATLALLLGRSTRARRISRGVMLVMGALLVVASLAQEGLRPRALELVFIDVGQGDSTFIRFPNGKTMLVDAGGSLGKNDPGERQVVPFLRARGVSQLDFVVVSHLHADHVAGMEAVLRAFRVRELWACLEPSRSAWAKKISLWGRRAGLRIVPPRPMSVGQVAVTPLWPPGQGGACGLGGLGANENSVVLRLAYGRRAALLTGDIETYGEEALLRSSSLLAADVLKVPHHGSATSSTPAWLGRVSPELAVISCGTDNSFHLPAPRVIRRYIRLGAKILRTDLHGAVTVSISADGVLNHSVEDDGWGP